MVEQSAAKVAIEIGVGFQQRNGNAFSRQQQRKHHAGGTTADNDTCRVVASAAAFIAFAREEWAISFLPLYWVETNDFSARPSGACFWL